MNRHCEMINHSFPNLSLAQAKIENSSDPVTWLCQFPIFLSVVGQTDTGNQCRPGSDATEGKNRTGGLTKQCSPHRGASNDMICRETNKILLSQRNTKPTKRYVRPEKTKISLGIYSVWSESLLCTQWVVNDPTFLPLCARPKLSSCGQRRL